MKVIGLDISLGCTGLAGPDQIDRIKTGKTADGCSFQAERINAIRGRVERFVLGIRPDLAVVESPAYSRQGQAGHHDLAGCWWVVLCAVVALGVPFVLVTPNHLKQYATGNGAATKADMIEAARWTLGKNVRDDNEADALWLRAMGCDWAGQPLAQLGAEQRRVLCEVKWPNLVRR